MNQRVRRRIHAQRAGTGSASAAARSSCVDIASNAASRKVQWSRGWTLWDRCTEPGRVHARRTEDGSASATQCSATWTLQATRHGAERNVQGRERCGTRGRHREATRVGRGASGEAEAPAASAPRPPGSWIWCAGPAPPVYVPRRPAPRVVRYRRRPRALTAPSASAPSEPMKTTASSSSGTETG